MFKNNNKDTRTTSMTSCWCSLLLTYFSSVSTIDFEQVNVSWDETKRWMFLSNNISSISPQCYISYRNRSFDLHCTDWFPCWNVKFYFPIPEKVIESVVSKLKDELLKRPGNYTINNITISKHKLQKNMTGIAQTDSNNYLHCVPHIESDLIERMRGKRCYDIGS